MGTKPMVFPLDGSGRLYALYDENDEQICTGSRDTCYRLLALMIKTKKPVGEGEAQTPEGASQPEQALHAAAGSSSVILK